MPSHLKELVRARMEKLRYGVVQLVIHDGKVIQVEYTEKTRFGPDTRPAGQPPKR